MSIFTNRHAMLYIVTINALSGFLSACGGSDTPSSNQVITNGAVAGSDTITPGSPSLSIDDEAVEGPVDTIDSAGNLIVLGQNVVVSENTVFDDTSLSSIKVGDIVEVSGLRDNNQVINATFIELESSTIESFEVLGIVSELNRNTRTFSIGELTVDFSTARFDDIAESSLNNGILLEVEDEALLYEPGSFFLVATKIEGSLDFDSDDDDS